MGTLPAGPKGVTRGKQSKACNQKTPKCTLSAQKLGSHLKRGDGHHRKPARPTEHRPGPAHGAVRGPQVRVP